MRTICRERWRSTSKKCGRISSLAVDFRPAWQLHEFGAVRWPGKKEFGHGKFFQGKVVIKPGRQYGPGRQHDEDACTDIASYALSFSTSAPGSRGTRYSDYLPDTSFQSSSSFWPGCIPWTLPQPKFSYRQGNEFG